MLFSHDLRQEIKPLLGLMFPILLTQFSQTGLGLIDTIMAGRLSAQDLASVAVAVGLWVPIMLLFSGVIFATTPLVAKAIGEKNRSEISKITQHALILAFILGLIACGILQLLPYFLHIFDVPAHLIPKASLFLQAIGFGMPAVLLYTALRCYSEALGFAQPITLISLASLIMLIPLNYIFMYGWGFIPALGGAGCGFATAILQWLILFILMAYLRYSKNYQDYPLFSSAFKLNSKYLKTILLLGLPIGFSVFFEVSLFSTASLIISPLGEHILSGHQITISITSILFMIPMSLALALTIRGGIYYGEKNWHQLRQVQKLGFMIATILALATMLISWFIRSDIVHIYTQDALVIPIAIHLVSFAIAYQLVDAWQVCASGCLRGMQDTTVPMWITCGAYWGIAFPIGYYLVRHTDVGASGVWIGFIVGLSVSSICLLLRLYQQHQKLR